MCPLENLTKCLFHLPARQKRHYSQSRARLAKRASKEKKMANVRMTKQEQIDELQDRLDDITDAANYFDDDKAQELRDRLDTILDIAASEGEDEEEQDNGQEDEYEPGE
jgi:CHAD domain-containing protein